MRVDCGLRHSWQALLYPGSSLMLQCIICLLQHIGNRRFDADARAVAENLAAKSRGWRLNNSQQDMETNTAPSSWPRGRLAIWLWLIGCPIPFR